MTLAFNQPCTRTHEGKTETVIYIAPFRDGHESLVCLCERKNKPNAVVATGELSDLILGSRPARKAKAENTGHEQPSDTGATAL